MKKIILAFSAASLGVVGLVTPAQAAASTIAWAPCPQEPLKSAGAECGFVDAPLDYAKPDGEKIQLAVSRVKAKAAQSQGPILINPGGPGGSGLNFAIRGSRVPNKVGEQYDWIGFDPRGVGSSKPTLACDENISGFNRPPYVPTSREIEKANLDRAKAYAEACKKAPGAKLLDHIKTVDNVRDMDTIRQALGVKQISYYGYSYGTYLGQVYATLFGKNLKRMVIDGVVNHKDVWYQANLNQNIAFEKVLNRFFEWIAQYNDTYKLGATRQEVSDRFYADKKALEQKPADGKLGGSEFTDAFLPAGYRTSGWDGIARNWANWVYKGDASGLIAAYGGPGDDNGFAIYNGTQCTDVQWPQSWNKWRVDNWISHAKAPFNSWANAWYNAPCLYWPAKPGKPVDINPKGAPKVLILSEELDGATPYPGALEARRLFRDSSLISVPNGTVHGAGLGGNLCVDNQIAAYLADGTLPPRTAGNGHSDTTCTPRPLPVPAPEKPAVSASTRAEAIVG
ncbi:alpha/beta hydrolase [Pseudonocardiaceae bacterium YIM PH 21723]|nr:alpha/beta hydrolase [Pseudonocardiaceae bacterium YIM PH 21723]